MTPVSVEDPPPVEPPAETVAPEEPGPARAAAEDLGDITELAAPRFPLGTLDGGGDTVAWYRFTLSEAREVVLGLRRQDADADLVLEDAAGNVLHSSERSGTANEWLRETLLAGTYYVRVEAQEAGANAYVFRYGVGDADPAEVTRLEAEQESVQEQVQQQPPAFGSQFYGFDLPENTDGSANRISLGTVSATDPDGGSVTYSIEGGNAARLFEIDAASGELFYTGGGEDYETGSTSFELTVRASDGDQTTDTTATVSVTDVDEPVEVDPPVAQPDQSTPQTVSEPAGEDFSAGTSTSGRVAVGETATGNIGSNGDRDWLAVELVAGRTYVIDLRGSPTDDGTLSDPYLGGIHDSDGNLIPRTTNDDGGQGYNSRVTFTATESGTHYIAAGAAGVFSGQGTYEVEVTDTSPPIVAPDPDPEDPPDTQEQVQQQPPAFGSQFYGFELPENADGSADRISLGTVSATDPDGGSVTYSIEGGNAAGLFEIDAVSGELFYTGGGEDHETGSTSFELTVRASDGDQTTDTTATVSVTDVDEPVEVDPPVAQPDQSTPQTVSEPSGEDFSADTSTSGRVAVGDTATGNIAWSYFDHDWFAVELVAGRTYVIDLRGSPTDDGTLRDPYLHGIYDSDGNFIPRTWDDDGGQGYNSRVTFTATESGTHYIAAGAAGVFSGQGTYEVEVTDTSSTIVAPDPDSEEPPDTQEQVQQQPPAFGSQFYGFDLPENTDGSTNRISLGTVSAVDPEGDTLTYSIEGGNAAGLFEIDAASGELFYTGTGEDYETGSTSFELTVRASDGDQTTDTAVTVNVTDVDEPVEVDPPVAQPDQSTPQTVSEPAGEDFSAGASTSGRVAVGDTATGNIGSNGDRDWFAVELVAGRTYVIDLRGSPTGDGTLSDPYLGGIHDSDGNLIARTTNDDGGQGYNSRLTFTATESGTHYIAAGAYSGQGTYEVEVTDTSPSPVPPEVVHAPPAFDRQTHLFELEENSDGSVARLSLGTVTATDPEGATISYRITDGNNAGLFEIDAASGEVFYTGSGEDYETGQTTHLLTVRASDGSLSDDTLVVVDVTDVLELPVELPTNDGAGPVSEPLNQDLPADTRTTGVVVPTSDWDSPLATGNIQTPGDVDWFAMTLQADHNYLIRVNGANRDDVSAAVIGVYDATGTQITTSGFGFSPATDGTYYVAITREPPRSAQPTGLDHPQTGPYSVRLWEFPDLPEDMTTPEFNYGDGQKGSDFIETPGDRDWIKITSLEAGASYIIDVMASNRPGLIGAESPDVKLFSVRDSTGAVIPNTEADDGGVGQNARLKFTAPSTGTYYLEVGTSDDSTGLYDYRVIEDDYAADETTTGEVPVDGTITGNIERGYDRDWFELNLESGTRYTITVEGARAGGGTLEESILLTLFPPESEPDDTRGPTYINGDGESVEIPHWNTRELIAWSDDPYFVQVTGEGRNTGTYTLSVSEYSWGDDLADDTTTTGSVEFFRYPSGNVRGQTVGIIESAGDEDWFAVELEAGRTYNISLRGRPTYDGTLTNPYLDGVHDANGNFIANASDDDGGEGLNSRVAFTPTADGTYYVAAGAYGDEVGTYELTIWNEVL